MSVFARYVTPAPQRAHKKNYALQESGRGAVIDSLKLKQMSRQLLACQWLRTRCGMKISPQKGKKMSACEVHQACFQHRSSLQLNLEKNKMFWTQIRLGMPWWMTAVFLSEFVGNLNPVLHIQPRYTKSSCLSSVIVVVLHVYFTLFLLLFLP